MPQTRSVKQKSVTRTQQIGGSGSTLTPNARKSKLQGHHVSGAYSNNVKIDAEKPLIATQHKDDILTRESDRRYKRIADIADMLEKNGALSTRERRWLYNLYRNDYRSYHKIGELLSVPSFWRPRQHGVSDVADRNKIRMQTLKAVVFEALRTDGTDDTDEKRKTAVARAIGKATQVRKGMNARYAGGKKPRIYNLITTKTLQDPRILYTQNDDIVANLALARRLKWPPDIHGDIKNQSSVAKAATALIDNKLLNAKAANTLWKMLRDKADHINQLMALNVKDVPRMEDREKIRSFLLMHLAYHGDALKTMRVKYALLEKVRVDAPEWGWRRKRWGQKHEELLHLPDPGRPSNPSRDTWIRNTWFGYMDELEPSRRVHESYAVDLNKNKSGEKTDDSDIPTKDIKIDTEDIKIDETLKKSLTEDVANETGKNVAGKSLTAPADNDDNTRASSGNDEPVIDNNNEPAANDGSIAPTATAEIDDNTKADEGDDGPVIDNNNDPPDNDGSIAPTATAKNDDNDDANDGIEEPFIVDINEPPDNDGSDDDDPRYDDYAHMKQGREIYRQVPDEAASVESGESGRTAKTYILMSDSDEEADLDSDTEDDGNV